MAEFKAVGRHVVGSMKPVGLPIALANLGGAVFCAYHGATLLLAWFCVGVGGAGMLAWAHFLED